MTKENDCTIIVDRYRLLKESGEKRIDVLLSDNIKMYGHIIKNGREVEETIGDIRAVFQDTELIDDIIIWNTLSEEQKSRLVDLIRNEFNITRRIYSNYNLTQDIIEAVNLECFIAEVVERIDKMNLSTFSKVKFVHRYIQDNNIMNMLLNDPRCSIGDLDTDLMTEGRSDNKKIAYIFQRFMKHLNIPSIRIFSYEKIQASNNGICWNVVCIDEDKILICNPYLDHITKVNSLYGLNYFDVDKEDIKRLTNTKVLDMVLIRTIFGFSYYKQVEAKDIAFLVRKKMNSESAFSIESKKTVTGANCKLTRKREKK